MTLRFVDVRIAQLAVEASSASIDGQAKGPFGAIGDYLDYEDLFAQARGSAEASSLPWPADKPRGNKFWKRYVTARLQTGMEDKWPRIAWEALSPLKVPATMPTIHLHADDRRSYSEAYVWPTALGVTWNNWIKGDLGADDLADILDSLRNDMVGFSMSGGAPDKQRMKTLIHQTLDSVRGALWGDVGEGVRSDPITIVSVIQASDSDTADSEADVAAALKALLDRIETDWGERPQLLPGDREAQSGHSVYAAKGLRLVWLPNSFLAKGGRFHRVGCFHRNLLVSTLQVEMLAATAQMFAAAKPKNGSLPADYAPFVDRLEAQIDFFLSGGGYSAPFLSAQLERGPVKAARTALAGT